MEVVIAKFVLEDFEEFLTQEEIELLKNNEYARHKLNNRFCEATSWHESAEIAVEVWRQSKPY